MSIIQIFHGQGSNKRLFKITSNQRLKKRIEVCIRTNLGNGLNIFFYSLTQVREEMNVKYIIS